MYTPPRLSKRLFKRLSSADAATVPRVPHRPQTFMDVSICRAQAKPKLSPRRRSLDVSDFQLVVMALATSVQWHPWH